MPCTHYVQLKSKIYCSNILGNFPSLIILYYYIDICLFYIRTRDILLFLLCLYNTGELWVQRQIFF